MTGMTGISDANTRFRMLSDQKKKKKKPPWVYGIHWTSVPGKKEQKTCNPFAGFGYTRGEQVAWDTLHQGCLPSSLTGSLNKLELNIFKNLHVFKDE